jgi:hypothetical protein
MLAAIRPDTWNWLLFFHLLFAFVLVGATITVVLVSLAAVRPSTARLGLLLRAVAFWTTLGVVAPALIGLRVFGQLLADREFGDDDPDWLGASFLLTDVILIIGAALLILIQYWTLRRLRKGKEGWPARIATYLPAVLLVAMAAVIVLMSGKPGG